MDLTQIKKKRKKHTVNTGTNCKKMGTRNRNEKRKNIQKPNDQKETHFPRYALMCCAKTKRKVKRVKKEKKRKEKKEPNP